MANTGEYENESIWDSAAPGWAKWELVLMNATAEATEQMLEAAKVHSGTHVLDLACGAGSQTIQAAERVGSSGRVIANDISSKMLTLVASNAAAAGLTNIETLHTPAERLSESGLLVNAATCRLGLMLFQSPRDALAAVRAVLAENGRIAVLVFASPQKNPLFSKTMMIALQHAGKSPPLPGSPGLFALSDPLGLESLFQATGYTDIRVEPIATRLLIASVDDALAMMQEAFGAYRAVLADLNDEKRDEAWRAIRVCLEQFSGPDGVSADMNLLLASGTNPPT